MTQVCTYCVMDDSAGPLNFDEAGRCICCRDAQAALPHHYLPNAKGSRDLEAILRRIREEGRQQPYDCMVGLSGGVDSAYLAHLACRKFNLRVLAVHVDAGWNTEPAVSNIERIVRALKIDLFTHVVEWDEMRDLQLAFLRAGVPNQDIPQDHAFFATLYALTRKFGIRTFLSGVNFSTESINYLPLSHPWADGRHLHAIHSRYGTKPLKNYHTMTIASYLWHSLLLKRPQIERPLNLMTYRKDEAARTLATNYNWVPYGTKHSESRFTKFYQDIYLPLRYGFDKRRLHLSSQIVSGQISRSDAVDELSQPAISERQAQFESRFVAKKLGISIEELTGLITATHVTHQTFPNDKWMLDCAAAVRHVWRSAQKQSNRSRQSQ